MDHRFPRTLLGVAIAVSLSVSPFAVTPALPSAHPAHNNRLAEPLQLPILSDNQLTAAVVLSPVDRRIQPKIEVGEPLHSTFRKPSEYEEAIRNGLPALPAGCTH